VTVEIRVQVRPAWPFRLTRRSGMDGLSPVRGGVLHRLLHVQDEPVCLRVAQLACGDVLIGAQARYESRARTGIAMMRRGLGTDLALSEFHERFRTDPLIGHAVRRDPTVRPAGRPDPFEALAWAVTEQLIEYERAAAIQRRMVAVLGRRDAQSGLSDSPSAVVLAGVAPARLASFDLAAARAMALTRVAREVAAGRVDLDSEDPSVQEAGWRRLLAIPGIGPWTIEIMALSAQRRLDQIPAGDLGLIKLVGRFLSGGDPHARATEQQVRDVFARFGRWQGLAASYALRVGGLPVSAVAAA
jgi:3-methyladenine DNA glycosylase/8-oxoguanine DNA glycosylase